MDEYVVIVKKFRGRCSSVVDGRRCKGRKFFDFGQAVYKNREDSMLMVATCYESFEEFFGDGIEVVNVGVLNIVSAEEAVD